MLAQFVLLNARSLSNACSTDRYAAALSLTSSSTTVLRPIWFQVPPQLEACSLIIFVAAPTSTLSSYSHDQINRCLIPIHAHRF